MTAVELQRRVRERARNACEFCLQPQGPHELRFPIDHVIPRQHGGPTTLTNLAVACHRCNLHKGPNLTGLDPDTGKLARLYNPRRQRWATHFATVGVRIVGRTAIGRTTAAVLNMNSPARLAVREGLAERGLYPPPAR